MQLDEKKYNRSGGKSRNEVPSPEEISPGPCYAITLNGRGTFAYLSDYAAKYASFVRSIARFCVISLNPEISKAGRLHYHGGINFPDYLSIGEFYLQLPQITKEFTICIRPITSQPEWNAYCQKQMPILKAVCKSYKLPYQLSNTSVSSFPKTVRESFADCCDDLSPEDGEEGAIA